MDERIKVARYFVEQVLRKRPYVKIEWCVQIVANPLRRERQADGRVRFWGMVDDPRDGKRRALRVVTLEDGETLLNAFFDRRFREEVE